MKHRVQLILLIWLIFSPLLWSQGNPSVGIGTFTPDPSAILELRSTSKGFLVPRMTTAQRNAISSPALWLLIFNTDTQQFEYWNGTVWIPLISIQNVSNSAWSLSGNTLTGSEFLGSVNLQPVVFKTNGAERMRISTTGNVGIGIITPTNTLHVKATSNPLRLEGLQSLSNASTILAVDANGVVYTTSASSFTASNAWSLTGNAGTDPNTDFLGTTDNQPLVIRTNNTERMRILASGLVGIGTNTPTNTLHVKATSNPLRLEGVQTTASASTLLAIDANGVVVSTSASTFVANNAWALSGNTLTGSEFLGSVNAQPVVIRTNNTEAMRIDANQRVGIGTNAPSHTLHVAAPSNPLRLEGLQSLSNAGTILAVDANGVVYTTSASAFAAANAWSLTGNAGTDPTTNFLGTTDNQPLVIRVNNLQAVRIEPTNQTINIIVGTSNIVTAGVYGAVISGGGYGNNENKVTDNFSTVSGGVSNQAGNNNADVTDAQYATVGGGYGNTASGLGSTISGGWNNTASAARSTIGGGYNNNAIGWGTTIGGGADNIASSEYSTVSGGKNNNANVAYSTIGGGLQNTASGQYSTIGGGLQNTASGQYSTIGGGLQNTASGQYSTIGGGSANITGGDWSTVSGGWTNIASGGGSVVGGGRGNTAGGAYSTIPGGLNNSALGDYTYAGGRAMYLSTSANHTFVWGYATATSAITASDAFLIGPYGNNYRVGINVVNPTAALHVTAGTWTYPLRLEGLQPLSNAGTILAVDANGVVYTTSASAFAAANAWTLTGNAGTDPAINFLGTTDNQPLVIRTNNLERMRISTTGNVGIGISTPTNTLHVKATSNPLRLEGVQTTASASTLLAIDANGVVVSTSASTFVANNAWALSGNTLTGSEFLGSVNAQPVVFKTSGIEAMRIDVDQQVGIGTSTPTNTLHVKATIDPLRLEGLQTTSATATVLVSDAAGIVYTTSASALAAANAWSLTGNAGTNPASNFLGTTDNQPLIIKVNNAQALRIEPTVGSPNILGGYGLNSISSGVVGAVISGGGSTGLSNKVTDNYGVIGGGVGNQVGNNSGGAIDAQYATVGGGYGNTASSTSSTVGGGELNIASGLRSTVGGGYSNTASGDRGTVGGGYGNTASGPGSTVAGGENNTASGGVSAVGGGDNNIASGDVSTVGGGYSNIASGAGSTVGGGTNNTASGNTSTVSGGAFNTAAGDVSWAGGAYMYLSPTADHTFVWGYATATSAITASDAFLIGPYGNNYRVGINVVNPTAALHVTAGTWTYPLRLEGLQPLSNAGTILAVDANGVVYTTSASAFAAANAWALTGNAGTDPAINFLGTTDNQPLVIRINNLERMRISTIGNVGIGISTPTNTLHVKATSDPLRLEGVQSSANATTLLAIDASGVVVSTSASTFVANNAWALSGNTLTGSEFLGSVNAQPVVIRTNNTEAMRIDANQRVGIGTNAPSHTLHVAAPSNPLRLEGLQPLSNAGTILAIDANGVVYTTSATSFTAANAWSLTGNAGTDPNTDFLGTTDNQPLVIRTNNTERMRILASGLVGIGTSTPSHTLHVKATSDPLRLEGVQSSANATTLLAIDVNGVVVSTSASTFVANNAWALSGNTLTGSEFLGSVNAQPVVIRTNNTEAMRIDASQRVGIGTNAPSHTLHVAAPSNPLRLEGLQSLSNAGTILAVDANGVVYTTSATSFTAANAWALSGNTLTGSEFLGSLNAQPVVFKTNGVERMRITAAGDIGIGTTTPGAKVDIRANSASDLLVRIWNAGGNAKFRIVGQGGSAQPRFQYTVNAEWLSEIAGNTSTGLEFRVRAPSDPNDEATLATRTRMVVGRTGNVGIGTLSPTNRLHVVAPSNPLRLEGLQSLSNAGTILAVDANGVVYTTSATSFTAANAWALSGNAGTDPNTDFLGTTDNQPLVIRTNNTERMRILASGLVGIGTNTPTNTLHVKATSNPLRLEGVQTTASASTLLAIDVNGVVVSTSASTFVANNAWALSGNTLTGSEFLGSVNAQPVVIRTNNTEAMRIDANQRVGIGTNAPSHTLHVAAPSNPLRLEGLQSLSNAGTILAVDANGVVYTTSASSFTASNAWSLTGNAGTDPTTNFLGTTDNQPLVIRTNNLERMRISTTGNVGIGISTPTNTLHVKATSNPLRLEGVQTTASASTLLAIDANGVVVSTSASTFVANNAWALSGNTLTGSEFLGSVNAQPVVIRTNNTEAMRIDANQRVGIGTNAPSHTLHVAAPSNPLRLEGLQPLSNAGTILAVDANGVVYTTSASSFTASNAWSLTGNAGTDPTTNFLGTTDNQPLVIRTNNAERMRVLASGYVGVGTTSPTARLMAVEDAPGQAVMRIQNLDAAGLSGIEFLTHTSAVMGYVGLEPGGGALRIWSQSNMIRFYTNGVERVRITTTGNVGIGSLDPQYRLHIEGDGMMYASGEFGKGATMPEGAKTAFIWNPRKAALRAGSVTADQWNDAQVGAYTVAFGKNTIASGAFSVAVGENTVAEGAAAWVGGRNLHLLPDATGTFAWGNTEHSTSIETSYAFLIGPGDTPYRVGINTATPTYALELPNDSRANVGQARANAWLTYADPRMWSATEPIGATSELLSQLQPLRYRDVAGKSGFSFDPQQLAAVLPEAVGVPADSSQQWSINYAALIPVLVAMLQEQQQQIQQLRQQNLALQQQVAETQQLRKRLAKMEQQLSTLEQLQQQVRYLIQLQREARPVPTASNGGK